MPFIYVLAVEQLNEGCLLHSFLLSWMMNEWYIVFHPASSPTLKDMHANAIMHAWQDTCVAGSGAYCTCTITLVVRRCASYSTAILWIHPCMHRRQCTSSPGKQYTPKLFWARDEDDACTQHKHKKATMQHFLPSPASSYCSTWMQHANLAAFACVILIDLAFETRRPAKSFQEVFL